MAGSFSAITLHVVFSTKDRKPLIEDDIRPDLHAYLGGIARSEGALLLAAGGIEDHTHLLLSLPPKLAPSKLVGILKSKSSAWMKDVLPQIRRHRKDD